MSVVVSQLQPTAWWQELARVRSLLQNGGEEDDCVVYRFLRGYRFDVEKAAEALDKAIEFRTRNNLADIRSAFPVALPPELCSNRSCALALQGCCFKGDTARVPTRSEDQ